MSELIRREDALNFNFELKGLTAREAKLVRDIVKKFTDHLKSVPAVEPEKPSKQRKRT